MMTELEKIAISKRAELGLKGTIDGFIAGVEYERSVKEQNHIRLTELLQEEGVKRFTIWKDKNFNLHTSGKYFPCINSVYYDITKHDNQPPKPTIFYTLDELFNIYKDGET